MIQYISWAYVDYRQYIRHRRPYSTIKGLTKRSKIKNAFHKLTKRTYERAWEQAGLYTYINSVSEPRCLISHISQRWVPNLSNRNE